MNEKLKELKLRRDKISAGGGPKRVEAQHAKGKMTARERIESLLDAGSFTEVDAFVEHRAVDLGMDKTEAPGEGVVIGYGTVSGRIVTVFAQDFTVVGGSLGEMHAAKICKAMDLAMKIGCPCVGINDSGGARIQEGVDALSGYGDIFYRNTLASGVIPQISVIMGPCAGGAVYSPALTDFTIMVDKTANMFITGPQVIKAVTREDVTAEALGGALVHSQTSGCASLMFSNEQETLDGIRKLLSYLPQNNVEDPPVAVTSDDVKRSLPALAAVIPDAPNKPYDTRDVIRQVFDDGDFFEIQPLYAQNIVTCFARLGGKPVGIVANQPKIMAGVLDINASDKASRFIRFCDAFNIPLVTLTDTAGYLPGVGQEHAGVIRHGAKLLYAYSEATVPKITVIVRKAYGGAYIAMCSRHLGADQVFAWPSAEIAVMGPDGAANIIFKKEIDEAANPDATRKEMIEEYKRSFANPYKAAVRGYVDDVIDPADTRIRLATALTMLAGKRETRPAKKHGNFPV
ncbi:MAG: methylmalonyl-CoA carboxyltransferase [Spirochaetes bacterium GWD1_61_31]|nr:MAG: methylmalonyl-CoA carboxyltransferase [Spirochaetes bacterium GWB1_60_80]OHD29664.1 MAG: methylmalonyl-CoA carboxyltransferase [Spirochaetes bacterium GWC1_61_12]OHD44143.1 MAG: methylmalonyl-CoA carboxyltransferase [Spirochaetes bacterium GWD1_61_31]OHD46880.1 MAG: methylmalonyl-CoA carboxyltransferase [Spirochaetes bacterium GWE1_60_18]OHD61813.1 MAG: methylmalonyl-CoA carboxyltransferase [Spirochaetes bacterium GWF1_60_12]